MIELYIAIYALSDILLSYGIFNSCGQNKYISLKLIFGYGEYIYFICQLEINNRFSAVP